MSTTVILPDELMKRLDSFSRETDEIVGKALTAGAKIAESQVRKNLKAVLSGESSGQLENALGVSAPDIDSKTLAPNVRVGFAEPRNDDYDYDLLKAKRYKNNPTKAFVSYELSRRQKKNSPFRSTKRYSYYVKTNAMVANILEYGSKKHNQTAKPFMKPAADSTKSSATAEIKRVFDEEANKYLKTKG